MGFRRLRLHQITFSPFSFLSGSSFGEDTGFHRSSIDFLDGLFFMNVSARKSWVRRALNPYSVSVLVLALAGGGWWAWQAFGVGKSPRDLYQIATVQKGDLEDLVTATGTVQPRDYVDVGAQVSGQLKKLYVEVGSRVESGDLLAEIDPTVLKATVDGRRASLRNQQATLLERQSALELAQLQATRQKNLMAADATTKESLQVAEASLRAAKAQIAAVTAQIEQTESQLRADEANLNYAKIFAPMSGTVVSVTARQGQTLNANQTAPTILRVADLNTMTVQTQVSEAEVSKLRQGMEVYFTTLGGQGRRWYGALRKVEPTPTVTNNVVLYNALFDVTNTNNALMPNMTTQVFFIAASAQDVLLVPTSAVTLQRGQGGAAGRGGRRGERASAGEAASAASAPSRTASAPQAAASAPRRARPDTAASAPAPRASAPAGGATDRFASMSPEERRAAFEAMSPEERQAMRERRRAMREAAGESAPPPRSAEAPASAPRHGGKAAAAEPAASGPVNRGMTGGFVGTAGQRAPRKGTVKVIDAAGHIEERPVELGVTTRVQAQVLSGLNEGDEVVTGLKPPPAAQKAAQQGGLQQGPGGMPPPGAGGGNRGR
jgi:macrolide-specific efflux system membrane fusion protein